MKISQGEKQRAAWWFEGKAKSIGRYVARERKRYLGMGSRHARRTQLKDPEWFEAMNRVVTAYHLAADALLTQPITITTPTIAREPLSHEAPPDGKPSFVFYCWVRLALTAEVDAALREAYNATMAMREHGEE